MKKQFRYKKFLIIFGAVIVFFAAVFFAVRAIFPLAPNSGFSIEKKEIFIETIPQQSLSSTDSFVTKLPDGNFVCCYSTSPWETWNEEDVGEIRLYIINEAGDILQKLTMPVNNCEVVNLLTLDNGNIGIICSEEISDEKENYYLFEYSTSLSEISKKAFPENVEGVQPSFLHYTDGLFYSGWAHDIYVLDGDLNIIKEYPQFEAVNEYEDGIASFSHSSDGTVFLTEQLFYDKDDIFKPLSYHITDIKTNERTKLNFPDNTLLSVVTTLLPGDQKFDFYGNMSTGDAPLNSFFNWNINGVYYIGINRDGSYEKLCLSNSNSENFYYFTQSVEIDNKRYYAYFDPKDEEKTVDLYLYEYTAVYEE
jgi:hypothetical protein